VVVIVLGALGFFAGCSRSQGVGSDGHLTTKSLTRSTSNSNATSSTDKTNEETAVLSAYRRSWSVFEQALSTGNAYDQGLAATMVGTQLQNVRANLLGDRNAGVVGRGSVTLHPKIASLASTTASVIDCAYSTSELIYAKSGKSVPPITPPENDGIEATLVLTGGTWKVSQQKVTEGHCASDA
jgi:hypothetical protein